MPTYTPSSPSPIHCTLTPYSIVRGVTIGSPAHQAGLCVADMIKRIGTVDVSNASYDRVITIIQVE